MVVSELWVWSRRHVRDMVCFCFPPLLSSPTCHNPNERAALGCWGFSCGLLWKRNFDNCLKWLNIMCQVLFKWRHLNSCYMWLFCLLFPLFLARQEEEQMSSFPCFYAATRPFSFPEIWDFKGQCLKTETSSIMKIVAFPSVFHCVRFLLCSSEVIILGRKARETSCWLLFDLAWADQWISSFWVLFFILGKLLWSTKALDDATVFYFVLFFS